MARRRETTTTTTAHGRIQALLALACAAAAGMSGGAHAFVVGGAGGCSSGACGSGSSHQPHITRLASPSGLPLVVRPAATTGGDGGGVDGLYTNATPDPNRRVLRLAFLAASRPKVAPKSDKEKKLDAKVWGRWKLVVRGSGRFWTRFGAWLLSVGSVEAMTCMHISGRVRRPTRRLTDWRFPLRTCMQEESIDRPDPEDLKKYGAKLKPTYSHFEEDLVRDGRMVIRLLFGTICV